MEWVGNQVRDWLTALAALNGGQSPISRATAFRWSNQNFDPPVERVPGSGSMTRVESFTACYSAHVAQLTDARQVRAASARDGRARKRYVERAMDFAAWVERTDQSCPSPTPVLAETIVAEPAPAAGPAAFPLKL